MIRLPVPPSTNNLYATGKSGKRFRSAEYEAWITMAGYQLNLQSPPKIVGKATVEIACPRNNRRDLDNHCKAILDLLAPKGGTGIIRNDRYVELLTVRWHDAAEHKGYVLIELGKAAVNSIVGRNT